MGQSLLRNGKAWKCRVSCNSSSFEALAGDLQEPSTRNGHKDGRMRGHDDLGIRGFLNGMKSAKQFQLALGRKRALRFVQ
jgi:hypothetical protein